MTPALARWTRFALTLATAGLAACAEAEAPAVASADHNTFDAVTLYRGLMLGTGPAAEFLATRAGTPKLADLVSDPVQLGKIAAFQDRLIASMDSVNPGFLEEFANAMTSGDHLRIQAMYERAADLTIRTVLTLDQARSVKGALANREAVNAAVNQRLAELGRNDPEAVAAVQAALDALASASSDTPEMRPSFMEKQPDGGGGGGGGGGTIYVYAVAAAVYYVAAVDAAVVSNTAVAVSIYLYLAVTTSNTALAPSTRLGREELIHAVALNLAA